MLEIIICDNEKEYVNSCTAAIKGAIERYNLDAEVLLSTTNPNEVVSLIREKEGIFFVLLSLIYDIGVKGVDIAKKIREHDRDCYIVFATRHVELMPTVFEGLIRPSGFLNKPINIDDMLSVFLDAYCDHINSLQKEECYSITIGPRFYKIPQKSIYYFEAAQKKIIINTDTQRIGYYDSLETIGKELNGSIFVRCHKGFIINITKVERVDFSEMLVFLNNGACIPISRKYKDSLRQSLYNIF
ncbi:MAG: response regulator transcription factor [Clostridiaceae bacterium]|nr:response regulator transcription factor [Clostridiaceae bacterium]